LKLAPDYILVCSGEDNMAEILWTVSSFNLRDDLLLSPALALRLRPQ
jgi:hypothetical protein